MLKDRAELLLTFRVFKNVEFICVATLDTSAGILVQALQTRATDAGALVISAADWLALPETSNLWI